MMNNIGKLFRYFGLNIYKKGTIRQISLETGIPYMTLNRVIKKLEKQNLIITENVGKALVCSMNTNNNITKQHLILASESYKNHFLEKKPLIKRIHNAIAERGGDGFSAVLFGSYAAGKEQKHSDVDIMFIYKSKIVIKKLQDEFMSIEQIHDIEINPMAFTEKQFKEMLKSKEENVGKQVLKNNVVMHNPEFFWNIVYEVLR